MGAAELHASNLQMEANQNAIRIEANRSATVMAFIHAAMNAGHKMKG